VAPDILPPRAAPHHELLQNLTAFFDAHGVEAFAVGGFLRDLSLDRPVVDIDISIFADPLEIGPALADALDGAYFPLDTERRHARILPPAADVHIDLLPLRGGVEDDLLLRDYTIDAMAAPLRDVADGQINLIDPTGGLTDLRDGVVRLVSEHALPDDPLRALRGARLATQLGFSIDPATADLIRRHSGLLSSVAAERQRDELMLIMATANAAGGLRLLDDLTLLSRVLPELDIARNVEQPKEHHYDVFGHSIAAVAAMDMLLAEQQPPSPPDDALWRELWTQLGWWTGARDYFRANVTPGVPRYAVLKLCSLLHDIGKPETKSFEAGGRIRFFGHSDAGAAIAVRLMRRLRFSSREIDMVRAMIEAHLRPLQMAQDGAPSRRAVYRFFRDTGDAGIDTLFLSLADHLATAGPRINMDGWRRHVALVNYILLKPFQEPAVVSPPKLVDGDDLMAAFGLSPGHQIGELLELIREAHAAGEIATKAEALELARRHLTPNT